MRSLIHNRLLSPGKCRVLHASLHRSSRAVLAWSKGLQEPTSPTGSKHAGIPWGGLTGLVVAGLNPIHETL